MEKKTVADEWWQHALGSLKVNALGKTDLTGRASWMYAKVRNSIGRRITLKLLEMCGSEDFRK